MQYFLFATLYDKRYRKQQQTTHFIIDANYNNGVRVLTIY